MVRFIGIRTSKSPRKKYDAYFVVAGKSKVVPFGAAGMEDYTTHHDPQRQQRYLTRHQGRENWNNPMTPGALSRYILWSSPSLKGGLKNYRAHFQF
jgi:hypothetical protein